MAGLSEGMAQPLIAAADSHRIRQQYLTLYGMEPAAQFAQRGKDFPKLRAIGLGSARRLAEHFRSSGGAKLPHRGVNALTVGRDSRVAVIHELPKAASSCSITMRNGGK